MLKVEYPIDYLKGANLEVTESVKEEQNARQSTKSFQPKLRVKRQYNPNDINISKLFLAIREHRTGNPQLNKISKIKKLLTQIQNINDIDFNDNGNTPLHVAVSKGHEDIVKLLLKKGAQVDIKNNIGSSPLDIALGSGNQIIISELQEYYKLGSSNQQVYSVQQQPRSDDTLKELQTREPISIFQEIKDQSKKQNPEGLLNKLRSSYPNDLKIGVALKTGDCFFDSVAQGLNELKDKGLVENSEGFNVKSLRKDCVNDASKYRDKITKNAEGYFVSQKNVAFPHLGNIKDEKGNDVLDVQETFDKYLDSIKKTAEEGDYPIWGRPEIEGQMISNKYDVVLYFYSTNEENGQKITVTKVTPGSDEPEVFIEGENLDQLHIDSNEKVVRIVNYKQHFVPLLSNLEKDIEKAIEVSREEVFGIEHKDLKNASKEDKSQRIISSNSKSNDGLKLPENFKIGQAAADGNCFFDSFRQGLEQQLGVKVNVEQLRQYCEEFAQNNPPEWFINAIANNYDNNERVRSEILDSYTSNILKSERWGDPEVEGRILCKKYNVKLHVVENSSYLLHLQQQVLNNAREFSDNIRSIIMNSNSDKELASQLQKDNSEEASSLLVDMTAFDGLDNTHQLISSSGPLSLDNINYDDQYTIHIINRGNAHFEPILSTQEIQRNKQQSPDPSDYDDEITPEKELINIIKSRDSEEEKLLKIKRLFEEEPKPDINFQGEDKDTLLHIAVRKKKLKIIKWLIENEARTDIKNGRSRTQLEVAQHLGRQDIVEILKLHIQPSLQASAQQSSIQQKRTRTDFKEDTLTEQQVNKRLKEFTAYFVDEFEMKLNWYRMVLEEIAKKPGTLKDVIQAATTVGGAGMMAGTVGTIGLLALAMPGSAVASAVAGAAGAGATGGGKLGNVVGDKVGAGKHKEKAASLADLVYHFKEKENQSEVRKVLIEASFDIFQSFEMQFMRVTVETGKETRAMMKLAKDAVHRVINYCAQKEEQEKALTLELITEGLVLGRSKEGTLSKFVPKVVHKFFKKAPQPGRTVKDKLSKKEWKTTEIYSKVGLVVKNLDDHMKPCEYYKKKGGLTEPDKYGHRRLFVSESWDVLKEQYEIDSNIKKSKKFRYEYKLHQKIQDRSQNI